jgi:hypothetical protein
VPVDHDLIELEAQIDEALRVIAALAFDAAAIPAEGDTWSEQVCCPSALPVSSKLPAPAARVGLLSTPSDLRVWEIGHPLDASWDLAGVDHITPFIVVELAAGAPGRRLIRRTVVIAKLSGDPHDRLDRILARQFTDGEAFVRFLMLLLALAEDAGEGDALDQLTAGDGVWSARGGALLEALVRALASNAAAFDDIAHIVERLGRTDDGRALLPDGWGALWVGLQDARSRVREHLEDRQ